MSQVTQFHAEIPSIFIHFLKDSCVIFMDEKEICCQKSSSAMHQPRQLPSWTPDDRRYDSDRLVV